MAHRHFEGALHAQLYGKFRPIPPVTLIQRVIGFLKEKYSGPLNTCYDVGCGSGQSTSFFANHFPSVVGTDISAEQIRQAQKLNQFPNVSYIVSPAEKFENLENNSIELVTVCHAAHWFNLPEFYKESNRVLAKNGVLALYGYEFPCFVTGDLEKDQKLDERLQDVYKSDLREFVHKGSVEVYLEKYSSPRFQFGSPSPQSSEPPSQSDSQRKAGEGLQQAEGNDQPQHQLYFTDFSREEGFYEDCESSVEDMVNYCLTWSGYQNFLDVHGEEKAGVLITNLRKDLLKILDADADTKPEDVKFLRRTKFFLLMGRK